jgi:trehalose/maltose hydrolase-like predicted phosphorylase
MHNVMRPTDDPKWTLTHEGYSAFTESAVESRFALGNGFLGTRGSRSHAGGPTWVSWLGNIKWASWPRCYVAGLFDWPNMVRPVPVLLPVADWSRLRIVLDGKPHLLWGGTLLAIARTLDLHRGELFTETTYRTDDGIIISGNELRLVSQADRSVGMQLVRFSLDRDGVDVLLEASFDMGGLDMEPLWLEPDLGAWRAQNSERGVAIAGAVTLQAGDGLLVPERPFSLRWIWHWQSVAGQMIEVDRMVAVARADSCKDDPAPAAKAALARSQESGWRAVLAAHEMAWQNRWRDADIVVEGDDTVQRALRFAGYHLISAANPEDERVSVGARGLTGDAYFGHVFWDTEIYLLPFYTMVWPEAARAMLMYRFHTLPAARRKAAKMGCEGALYAWESADTGDEVTPESVVGPGDTMIDVRTGKMEIHISADIAYAIWQYWRVTGDDTFFVEAGAEILLETARFWASRAIAEQDGTRHIRHVIGPDEYHEDVDDNAFTNVMARWTIVRALEAIDVLTRRWPSRAAALSKKLAIGDAELADWRDAATGMVTGLDPATGIYEQFAGYHKLEPVDLSLYSGGKAPIEMLMGQERIQRSQVIKQADVVALEALLPEEFPGPIAEVNFNFYEPRCTHRSSLSAGMHALVAARLGDSTRALAHLHRAAAADLELDPDSAGGIRIAGLGGVWQAVVLGFAGLDLTGDGIAINPRLPPKWQSVSFRVHWRGRAVEVRVAGTTVTVKISDGAPVAVRIADETRTLEGGQALEVNLHHAGSPAP